jgi:hypothetical protein
MTIGGIWIAVAAIAAACGCGAPKPKPETLVPVSGIVKLDGKPTEGIRMMFHPTGETKGLGGCWAITDQDGKFKVIHWSNKEGLPPGSYHVVFSRKVKPDGTPLGKDDSPTMTQSIESIAPMYSNIAKAGLHNKVDVPDKGVSNLDFTLNSVPIRK